MSLHWPKLSISRPLSGYFFSYRSSIRPTRDLSAGANLSPWRATEALDEEVEKCPHFRHAMATMRVHRGERDRLGDVRRGEHRLEAALTQRIGDNEISKPRDAPSSNGQA
jgi:hypothetical protein